MKPRPKTTTSMGGVGGIIVGHGLHVDQPWIIAIGATVYLGTLLFDWLTTSHTKTDLNN